MRTQQEREDQAVAIATGLGIFTGVLVAVGLLAWVVQSVTRGLDGHEDAFIWPAVLLAGVVAGSHVARHRR